MMIRANTISESNRGDANILVVISDFLEDSITLFWNISLNISRKQNLLKINFKIIVKTKQKDIV